MCIGRWQFRAVRDESPIHSINTVTDYEGMTPLHHNSHPSLTSLTGINTWAGQIVVNPEWETGMKSEMV